MMDSEGRDDGHDVIYNAWFNQMTWIPLNECVTP